MKYLVWIPMDWDEHMKDTAVITQYKLYPIDEHGLIVNDQNGTSNTGVMIPAGFINTMAIELSND